MSKIGQLELFLVSLAVERQKKIINFFSCKNFAILMDRSEIAVQILMRLKDKRMIAEQFAANRTLFVSAMTIGL